MAYLCMYGVAVCVDRGVVCNCPVVEAVANIVQHMSLQAAFGMGGEQRVVDNMCAQVTTTTST
jgi:hypothetical protein